MGCGEEVKSVQGFCCSLIAEACVFFVPITSVCNVLCLEGAMLSCSMWLVCGNSSRS